MKAFDYFHGWLNIIIFHKSIVLELFLILKLNLKNLIKCLTDLILNQLLMDLALSFPVFLLLILTQSYSQ